MEEYRGILSQLNELKEKNTENHEIHLQISQKLKKYKEIIESINKANSKIINTLPAFKDISVNNQLIELRKIIPEEMENNMLLKQLSHNLSRTKEHFNYINSKMAEMHSVKEECLIRLKEGRARITEEISSYLKKLGIEINLDAYFDQEIPIEITSAADCTAQIKAVRDLWNPQSQHKYKAEEKKRSERAWKLVLDTCYWKNYLSPVLRLKAFEQIREKLSLAIEPKVGQEKQIIIYEEIDIFENKVDFQSLKDMINCADELIQARKLKKDKIGKLLEIDIKERKAKEKIDELETQNHLHIDIASRWLDEAIKVRKDIEKGDKSYAEEIEKLHKDFVTSFLQHAISNHMNVNHIPSYFEIDQFYQALKEEIKKNVGNLKEIRCMALDKARETIEKGDKSYDEIDKITKLQQIFGKRYSNYAINKKIAVHEIPGYSEIHQFYQALKEEITQRNKADKYLNKCENLIEKDKVLFDKYQSLITEGDREEFESNLKKGIDSMLYRYNKFLEVLSKINSVINFNDKISQILPDYLKSKLEKNEEAKAEIQTKIARLKQEYDNLTNQEPHIQEQITQLEQEVTNFMEDTVSYEQSQHMAAGAAQWYKVLQEKIGQITENLNLINSRLKSSQGEVTAHDKKASSSRDPLEITHESAIDKTQELLNDPMVKTLREVYRQKYGTEVDNIKANASASYLNKLKLVDMIKKQAIETATHLIKHFDATFNEVYINKATREIVIVKPSNAEDPGLSKVDFDLFGRLIIDGKKQKAFVTASLLGKPDVLILPVKAEMVYGIAAFAGGTPMLPGGTAGIEDLRELEKGNMGILAIAVEREFKEETRGKYQLVRETLKSRGQISDRREDALFFEAGAEPTYTVADAKGDAELTTTPTNMDYSETKGTVLFNIQEMVKEHQLNEKYISPSRREFTIKQVLLKEVQRLDPLLITKEVPQTQEDFRDGSHGEPQWGQYFTAYCTNHLVDYIIERIPAFGKQKQEISYRLLGSDDSSWRTISEDPDQRKQGSDSANWRGKQGSESANWRSGASSSSSSN